MDPGPRPEPREAPTGNDTSARTAIVVGAGISGLAIAGELARDGWSVQVLEQAPAARPAGYMIDFFGPGFEAARTMGLLPELRRRGHLYDGMRYVDRNGRTTAKLDMRSFLNAARGDFFSILRPDIEAGLRAWLPSSVVIHQQATVIGVEPGDVGAAGVQASGAPEAGMGVADAGSPAVAVLQDGRRFEADLLVGADGIHSAVRAALFGPEELFLRPLGYHVAGFIYPDAELARELGSTVVLTDSLERQAGLYALPDGRIAVFAVEATEEPAVPADVGARLREAYRGLGWRIPQAMEHATGDIYYDVVAQSEVPAWSRGRVVLTGDAAYAVSLLAGQGASLALAGARELTAALRTNGTDIGRALRDYESARRPVAEQQQRAGRRNAGFFIPSGRMGQLVRRVSLWVMGIGPLNRIAAKMAFGGVVLGKGHPTDPGTPERPAAPR